MHDLGQLGIQRPGGHEEHRAHGVHGGGEPGRGGDVVGAGDWEVAPDGLQLARGGPGLGDAPGEGPEVRSRSRTPSRCCSGGGGRARALVAVPSTAPSSPPPSPRRSPPSTICRRPRERIRRREDGAAVRERIRRREDGAAVRAGDIGESGVGALQPK